MSSSFEKINYNLRPNKGVERKMMCEALSRLSLLDQLDNYRYIGMGSPYFADFVLFHRVLGINDLISIEKEESKKSRFEFNKPFSCIQIKYGDSFTILPNLELEAKKTILWLDYDDRISDFMFADIDTFFSNALPGSVFILSVNVEELHMSNKEDVESAKDLSIKEYRLNELFNKIGRDRVPNEFLTSNMTTKNLTQVTHEMIKRQIETSLITRSFDEKNKVEYKPIFNFVYNDSTTILTIGGIIYDHNQKTTVDNTLFENLDFIVNGADSYKIQAPNLTLREIKALDKALPDTLDEHKGKFKNKIFHAIPLSATDIKNYAKIYRYFPNFAEANI